MYASLVTAYGRARRPQHALKVFAAMKREGVVPDVTLFNAVMKVNPHTRTSSPQQDRRSLTGEF
eukprot:358053-Pyramimonas_sp.AAC.1